HPLVWGGLSILVGIALWEILGRSGGDVWEKIPPPTKFIPEVIDNDFKIGLGSQAATLTESIIATLSRVVLGLSLGLVCALFTGLSLSSSSILRYTILPWIRVLAPIAPIAWIPLVIVLFGIGNTPAVILVFLGVYFSLTVATVRAVELVPAKLMHSAQTLGANRWQQWRYVVFPSILPPVFTALRLGVFAAWMAILAAEMVGLRDGLGSIINYARNVYNHKYIMLGIFLIGLFGALFDWGLRAIQSRWFWWENK
ncbi:MAG: ABC transporter permease, partial [Bacteroidota bacterium]